MFIFFLGIYGFTLFAQGLDMNPDSIDPCTEQIYSLDPMIHIPFYQHNQKPFENYTNVQVHVQPHTQEQIQSQTQEQVHTKDLKLNNVLLISTSTSPLKDFFDGLFLLCRNLFYAYKNNIIVGTIVAIISFILFFPLIIYFILSLM